MRIDLRTVGPFQENCYLVVDDHAGRGVLVDPGDDAESILDMVARSGADLEAIWLTHAHLDHIGALEAVRRRYDVPVLMHPLDRPYYDTLSARAAQMYGLPWLQPTGVTTPIADGDTLTVGSHAFRVLHVPGHAPGLVGFIGEGVALAGDLLFAGSIGRTDLPLCDPHAMDASLERIMQLDDSTIVHPGHGPSTTIGQERASNPFLTGRARPVFR